MTTVKHAGRVHTGEATRDYWRVYHPPEVLARADSLRKTYTISSTGVDIHVDAYEQAQADAPVFIFNHGGGGYSRLLIPIALAMHDRGYTVLIPDQRGQGLSGGSRSDFTMGQFVQNIVDVAHWAARTYSGELFMGGGSLGGALTYKAAAAGAPVRAIVCHNLYDFGNPTNTLAVSIFAPLAHVPGLPSLLANGIRFVAALLPRLKLPYKMLGRFDKMVDKRSTDFYARYQHDPYPIQRVTLCYMASMFNTAPAVPLEQNTLPVLVINQTRDEMVDPAVTRENYARLGGDKSYVEIDYGHWAIGGEFEPEWATIVDDYLKQFWATG